MTPGWTVEGKIPSAVEGDAQQLEIVFEDVGPPCVWAASMSSPPGSRWVEVENRFGRVVFRHAEDVPEPA